ncbi:MAG: type 4 pilin [Microcystis aeruginosa Ma_MB_S_20031200_S102]|uniref:Type 4 pilin n=1 Tax=Microcystis aeruginosa Ma_MB_S_20031200_S102 TaxID=2486254 RepID=A0A552F8X1_MICAE|nr:MAG: type 4 pilin [Microcystis aeruginosa Ma_MB_S_20031200_S102D]TRU43159.1 MAG: type 4 pilin [Microcystis aeruginosa Ma_MB_S_20031200_S102]
MLEVIVAILTITAFLTGTLQLMAFTALYKVRATRQTQANFWIQEDFENVKALASSLDVNDNDSSVNASNHDPDRFSEIYPNVCSDINQGYAIELRRRLPNAEPPDSPEFDPDDPSKDYAIPASDLPEEETLVATREIVGKNYSLYRTFPDDDDDEAQSAHPHRLRIEYKVKLADDQTADDYPNQEDVIAESSVEVVPDASFECP